AKIARCGNASNGTLFTFEAIVVAGVVAKLKSTGRFGEASHSSASIKSFKRICRGTRLHCCFNRLRL
ncbi:unnamed protein product, partial [Rotaria sordida]